MPAKSKKQRRFMGMVAAAKAGKLKNPSSAIRRAAGSMTKKQVDKFAKTKEKGLPMRVKKRKRKMAHAGDTFAM